MSIGILVAVSSRSGVSGGSGVVISGFVMVSDMGIDDFGRSAGNKNH